MGHAERAAAASVLTAVLLTQGATAVLTLPAPRDAYAFAAAPMHVEHAAECPALPLLPSACLPARERLRPVTTRPRAPRSPALVAMVLPAEHARSHPAARAMRERDPAPH